MKPIRVTAANVLHDYVVAIEFPDGTRRDIDLALYLTGPIFDPLRQDRTAFLAFSVGDTPTISWENGADIDPYTLYFGLLPEWSEDDDRVVAALEKLRTDLGSKGQPVIPAVDISPEARVR